MTSEGDAVWRRPDPNDAAAAGGGTPASSSAGAPEPAFSHAAAEAAPSLKEPGALAWPGPEGAVEAAPAAGDEPGSPVSRSVLMVAAGAVMGALVALAVYSLAVGSSGSGPNQFAFGGGRAPAPFQQVNPGFQRGQAQQPPGFQGQRGQLLPQIQNNALPRTPDFVGQVRGISGSSMTVDTANGSRVVQITADTRVFLADGSAGSASDLQRGSVVAVVTATDPATRLLVAEAVQVVR